MHRLFWKLFFAYWATLVLFSLGCLFAASHYLDQTRARQAGRMEEYASRVQAARAAATEHGQVGLRDWATSLDAEELVPLLVLDREGHDLLLREVSAGALSHLRRHLRQVQRWPADVAHPRSIQLPDGAEYWLIPDFQGANLGRFLVRPRVIGVPLVMGALLSGLVCLLLARYLTSPMERLRLASQAYAAGDFSKRVGPSLGGRRDEVADLAHALDNMAERLDTLLHSQRGLLRDVSHELRSPLARVQAALGLARQRGRGNERELDRIEQQMERLNELIGEILTFSRLDTGVHKLVNEILDLGLLLAEMVDNTQLEGERRGIRVEYTQGEPVPWVGDAMLMHSVLDNVLRNALLHSPDQGWIEVTLARDNNGGDHVIRIRDHGPGVPEGMQDAIFEPFVRVDAARDHNRGGVGLGLAIARRAIQAQRGQIRAENHPHGGLLVTIRLPRSEG